MPIEFLARFRTLVFAFLLIAASVLPALAGPFEDAVAKFANDDYSDTDEAIGAIATSGNPQAFAIISALQDGRLFADPDSKKVYLTDTAGKSVDVATGADVASVPDSAAAVRLNNRLRRTIDAALGGLTLMSPDPAKRVEAAQSVFKTHDAAMLPVVDQALEKETDRRAKQAFIEARDGFYQATVSESGWPYVQFRGGPSGFLKVIDAKTIGYADFGGNVQYLSVGNLNADARVALILMDYANRARLKIWGRARIVHAAEDAELVSAMTMPGYKARVERVIVISVEAFDWNCPQHITPRYTEAEVEAAVAPLRAELEALRARVKRDASGD